MDKMCNKSEIEDLNKTITNKEEAGNGKNRSSPVFKCFNQPKTVKGSNLDTSDYDIPSYQINLSTKSKTSSKYSNETSESVLPFTPILSPIPVASTVQFQPPSIHSLGTVTKNLDKNCQNKVSISNSNRAQNVKPDTVFENLGMTDKDISWVSSMATPPPKQVPGSELNTLEKATFLPDEKFQNIQPRALFSPTVDEDFGCHPIIFTSESEDNDDEYKSNIRLSDVCATLKQLEVKSLDLVLDNSIREKDSVISPVIRTRKKKLGKEKKKCSLVLSPENKDKYDFSVGENLTNKFESEKVKVNCGSDFLDDDSFQSISFSGIDELCKTLVSDQCNTTSGTVDCDRTLVNPNNNSKNLKKFYLTKATADVYTVSSMDNLHSYAVALEEYDKCNPGSSKISQPLTEKGIMRLDVLDKDETKFDATKRLHSEITEANDKCREKKIIKVEENSGWENVKHYLSESQLNVSDGEIFRTVENLEKTLASQESKELEKLNDFTGPEITIDDYKTCVEVPGKMKEDEKIFNKNIHTIQSEAKDTNQHGITTTFIPFSSDSGVEISVLEKDLVKAEENLNNEKNQKINSEKSHAQISDAESEFLEDNPDNQISVDTFKKVNSFTSMYENLENTPGVSHISENQTLGFFTGLGKQVQISDQALERAKIFLSKFEADEKKQVGESPMKDFSIDSSKNILEKEVPECSKYSTDCSSKSDIKISSKLSPTNSTAFKAISEEDIKKKNTEKQIITSGKTLLPNSAEKPKEDKNIFKGFSTGLGKTIPVSAEALKKAQSLMSECTKECYEKIQEKPKEGKNNFKGFSTGLGKTIPVSAEALKKAQSLMSECTKECYENIQEKPKEGKNNFKGFSTGLGKTIPVSAEALKKAQSLMSECTKECYEKIQEKPKEGKNNFKGFSTGLGKTIPVSAEALKKAQSLMSECTKECYENSDKLTSDYMRIDQNSFGEKEEERKNLDEPKKEAQNFMPCFSSASGSKVKISSKALEAAKDFWSKPLENASRTSESENLELPLIEPHQKEFLTAKQNEIIQPKTPQTSEETGNLTPTTESLKPCIKNIKPKTSESEEKSGTSDDWEEIIPSWLHVYNTSPSIASERIELSPLVCHEDGNSSKPDREYIVKSPILGSSDRFHGKRKRRRLKFEEEKKPKEKKPGSFVVPYKNSTERKTSAKRTSTLSIDFSVPFKKIKFIEDIKSEDLDVKGERERAREEQEKVIKEKQKVKPLKGSHLNKKCTEKQMSWKEAVGGCSPEVHSDEVLKSFGICEDVLKITVENSGSFRFTGENFFGSVCMKNTNGIPVGDGCLLILDDDNKFGVEELKRAFLASPGVQPNLVTNGWVENHLKWIIWKMAHYERSFPKYFGGKCLTPNQIMLQLKYRYDREIDRNERSALKKILERDDTSIKRLVLCVCGIKKVTANDMMGYELKLTDGWYSCPAHSDPAMTRLIEEGKISIGTKLVTQGAVLVNCEQGVSPLELNGDVYLKISTNSTRRIRWDAKLGFQKNPENFPISLGSVLPQGGPISRIDVIIVRIYPTLYMEKTSDGRHVTRNRRSEEKADSEYRRLQEERMEIICQEVQSEMKKSSNVGKNSNCLSKIEQVEDLRQLVESSSDPSALQELLSEDQRKLLENFQSNQNDRFRRELKEKIDKKLEKEKLIKRNVSEFLRAKIVDFRKPDYNNPALLCIWNPSEDLTCMLTEGKVFSLMNVTISNSSRIYKPLQINTTRQTQFRPIVRNVKYPVRKLTQLKDVSSKVCPAFEEVDVVGMVALVQDISHGSRLSQVFYLTDLEMNFVGVVFWGSCKDYGWENVLKISSVVACSNLQWKKNSQNVPSLYVNENSVFTENPRHGHLKEEIERLRKIMPQDKTAFLTKCEEYLTAKLEDSKSNTSKNSSNNDSTLRETTKPKVVNGFESRPTASSTPIKPFTARIGSDEAEPSPIQKRIEKLQSYGEPPSLIPLFVRNNARKKFKKPVKS